MHDVSALKIASRTYEGHWVEYDGQSLGHWVYCSDQHTMNMEHNIHFTSEGVSLPEHNAPPTDDEAELEGERVATKGEGNISAPDPISEDSSNSPVPPPHLHPDHSPAPSG